MQIGCSCLWAFDLLVCFSLFFWGGGGGENGLE